MPRIRSRIKSFQSKLVNKESVNLLTLMNAGGKILLKEKVFLLNWYACCDYKGFGFPEVFSLEDQLKAAVTFIRHVELEWQEKIKENKTNETFPEYFYQQAKELWIGLPENFISKFMGLGKG